MSSVYSTLQLLPKIKNLSEHQFLFSSTKPDFGVAEQRFWGQQPIQDAGPPISRPHGLFLNSILILLVQSQECTDTWIAYWNWYLPKPNTTITSYSCFCDTPRYFFFSTLTIKPSSSPSIKVFALLAISILFLLPISLCNSSPLFLLFSLAPD